MVTALEAMHKSQAVQLFIIGFLTAIRKISLQRLEVLNDLNLWLEDIGSKKYQQQHFKGMFYPTQDILIISRGDKKL